MGSADGGTIITIHGRHFNDPRNDVQVKVGGQLEFRLLISQLYRILTVLLHSATSARFFFC